MKKEIKIITGYVILLLIAVLMVILGARWANEIPGRVVQYWALHHYNEPAFVALYPLQAEYYWPRVGGSPWLPVVSRLMPVIIALLIVLVYCIRQVKSGRKINWVLVSVVGVYMFIFLWAGAVFAMYWNTDGLRDMSPELQGVTFKKFPRSSFTTGFSIKN